MGTPISVLFFSALFLSSFSELSDARSGVGLANLPPRGWNSYDSFSWIINEEEFLDNAKVVADKLHSYGYEYVVVDYLWYRKNANGVYLDAIGYDYTDEWGRVIPDPDRWPSSKGGKGFEEVAQKVHDMGLKFGIHAMKGINVQAVNAKKPILDVLKGGNYREADREWNAGDIGMEDMTCSWMKEFMSVNTDLGAGRAFLRSLYWQYAEWGVDFVKLDCVFGDDLDSKEILTVSELLEELDRPILLSLSPGTSVTPSMAEGISEHVDMYRITGDDWDKWEDVAYHFNVARDFAAAKKIGAPGLHGRSWPDLDMLPLGWLTDPGVQRGPHRNCSLTLDEQKSQITLWCMAKSPLMFGGDLRNIDETTYSLITHTTLLEINSYSTSNMEFPHIYAHEESSRNYALTQKFTSIDYMHAPDAKELQLASCHNQKSKGWFIASKGVTDKICWNYEMKISDNISNCLYKRMPLMTSDEDIVYREKYQGKFYLVPADTMDNTCLDVPTNRKFSASERGRTSLAECKRNAKQMWVLNDDGTLMNSYSGLCATVGQMKEMVTTDGVRSWIATGRRGEIYLAFFNLNPTRTQISTRMGYLAKVLNHHLPLRLSCNCSEVWTGKNFGIVKHTLSMMVEAHGCALFVVDCSN